MSVYHNPKEQEVLNEVIERLKIFFDSIQIFVANSDPTKEQTVGYCPGYGMFHGRYGMVREWLLRQEYLFTHSDVDPEDDDEKDTDNGAA